MQTLSKQYEMDSIIMEHPLIDPNWNIKQQYSHEDFWDFAYKDLGKKYGVNDIREIKG